MHIHDDFSFGINAHWQVSEQGGGAVSRRMGALHLGLPVQDGTQYANAQLTDYLPEQRNFQWRPPLRLTLSAFASLHPNNMVGTAGFGLWNYPYGIGARGILLPQALWFFFSAPPSDMPLAQGVAGTGWKAATFNARNWRFLALAPTAPLGFLLMRIPALHRALWGVGQRAIGVQEVALEPELLTQEHRYSIEWLPDTARFNIDDRLVHEARFSTRHALGFIVWMDNRWAIVTPQGRFAFGTSETQRPQALVLRHISLESL